MNTRQLTSRFLPALALVAALALPGTAFAQDPQALFNQAFQAMQGGNFSQCVTQSDAAFEAGGEAYERWGYLHVLKGICLAQLNRRDEAISSFQTAQDLVGEDSERFLLHHNLAQVYVARGNSGDYDRAIAAENTASQYAADANQRAVVAKTLGQAYYFKEDWSNAITHLSRAAESRTTDSDVAQKLGRAYMETGQDAQAMEWFQKTLQLDRENGSALTNIGRLYLQDGNWAEAASFLQRAVQRDPQNMVLRSYLGRAHLGARDYGQAIQQLEQVTQARPNDGGAWYNLGQAYQANEQDGRAIDAYTRALQFLPAGTGQRAEALYDIGFVYEKTGNYEDALQALEDSAAIQAQAKVTEAIERVKERIRREKEGGN